MLVPKKNRVAVFTQLFEDGVMVCKKDPFQKKHETLDVPNLHVMKLCQSLCSQGYVKQQFSWQYYYYFLTDPGINYLQKYLNLPSEIIPATLKKASRPAPRMPAADARGGGAFDKKGGGPGADFRPEFRGSGRGGGAPRGQDGYRSAGGDSGGFGGPRFGRGGGPPQ